MAAFVGILLCPLLLLIYFGFVHFFTYLATLLAARRKVGDPDLKNLYAGGVPKTQEQALEYLRHPEVETAASFLRKVSLYRFLLTSILIDGFLVSFTFLLQDPNPVLWYAMAVLMLIFTLCEFGIYRSGLKTADKVADPREYLVKTGDSLIGYTQITYSECRDLFNKIEQLSGRPWKIFRAICIAAAVLLLAAQLVYKYRVKDAGSGTLQMGGWQYRILDDGTAEIVRYKGIWKKIPVPASFHGVPVSSTGPDAFLFTPGKQG